MFGKEVPDKKIREWEIPLSSNLADKIRERAGRIYSSETKHVSGGYQGLVADLQKRLIFDGLTVDYLLIGRIFRQAHTPSGGGWETECFKILWGISAYFRGEEVGAS